MEGLMQIGVSGLGRMGVNVVPRLTRAGHSCAVHDANATTVATSASLVTDLVRKLSRRRAVWVMLPTGAITEGAVNKLGGLLANGDIIIIDAGNTYYRGDIGRGKSLASKGIRYVAAGTSGCAKNA
jgi:6-phosphogluconate dehydrogenase